MSGLITVRIQMGVGDYYRIVENVPQSSTVDSIRQSIRKSQNISPADGLVLISNGQRLRNPEVTLEELGICNDSMIICIISKERGREIEELLGEDQEAKYDDDQTVQPVLECEFSERPFGFAVWANDTGDNAIVTKVAGQRALEFGIKIGYSVYKVDDLLVFNNKHEKILECLKTVNCPVRISFVDLGKEYTAIFNSKPLGFTVVQDAEENNARVSKINTRKAVEIGVKVGWHVTAVNGQYVFGLKHKEIVTVINKAIFPINLRFRRPPKLLIPPKKKANKMKVTNS